MRRLLPILGFLCLCLPAHAASWSRVQSVCSGGTGGATSFTVTCTNNFTANNVVVCFIGSANTALTSVKEGTHSLTQAVSSVNGAYSGLWSYVVPSGAGKVITVTQAFNNAEGFCQEYSGNATTTPLDKSASGDTGFSPANGNFSTSTTATLAQSGELVVAGAVEFRVGTQTWTAGSGFFSVGSTNTNMSTFIEDNLSGGSGSGTAGTSGVAGTGTFSTFNNAQTLSVVATFQPSSGGGPTPRTCIIGGGVC